MKTETSELNITAAEAREKLLEVWNLCEFGVKERVKKVYSHRIIQYMLITETYSDTQKILNVIETIKEQCEAVKNEAIEMEEEINKALVSKEELKCMRRHLNQANEIFSRLENRGGDGQEKETPELTPQEEREQKYDNML